MQEQFALRKIKGREQGNCFPVDNDIFYHLFHYNQPFHLPDYGQAEINEFMLGSGMRVCILSICSPVTIIMCHS